MKFQLKKNVNGTTLDLDFLLLPKILYNKKTIHQNESEERLILKGEHPLSHYFSIVKFVLYDKDQPVGRAMLIDYPNSDICFIGYYECINNKEASTILLNGVLKEASGLSGKQKIVGPYDASFWLRYRMKLDCFNEPAYMSEPTNKSYYAKQFKSIGFEQKYTYVSNEYSLKYDKKEAKVFDDASKRARNLKYTIKSPKKKDFLDTLEQVYDMFCRLYYDFPGYTSITKEEFIEIFKIYAGILDYSFVKFAYYNDRVVGFVIGFPDYGNLLYRPMTVINRARIAARRIRAGRYVVTYLGVLPEHSGLGKALVRAVSIQAILRGARVLGALALTDKVTATYAKKMIKKRYNYGLFEKKL